MNMREDYPDLLMVEMRKLKKELAEERKMGGNDEQVLCLVSEAGAGAKYMSVYDSLPSGARRSVREAHINVCMACFGWADDYERAEDIIKAMHREDLNRRREYYAGE